MLGCVIRSQDSAHWRLADIRNSNATAFTQITIRIKFQEFQRPKLAIVPPRNLIADFGLGYHVRRRQVGPAALPPGR